MRSALRFLFNRALARSPSTLSRIQAPSLQARYSQITDHNLFPSFLAQNGIQIPKPRHFSSEATVDPKKDEDVAHLVEIFSKSIGSDELKSELDKLTLDLEQGTVHSVLQKLEESPENAKTFFDWVLEREVKENRLLRSKSLNLMLEIIGRKGKAEEFWGLNKIMKERGYGVSKETFFIASKRFKNDGMEKDFNLLNEMCSTNPTQIGAARFRKILLRESEPEAIHIKLDALGIDLTSDLVVEILDQVSSYPRKALIFLQWVEEKPSFKIDSRVTNAMARALGREDFIGDFWEILHKMKNSGFEIEKETYVKVINRFYKRKMILPAMELYEFAMGVLEKPYEDFLFLLKKVLVSKELDMGLVSNVVRIFTSTGNVIKISAFDSVLKSLRSVGRLAKCDNVLEAMKGGGFVADAHVYGRVVSGLSDAGKLDEALEYAEKLEKSGTSLDFYPWSSLVQKNSLAGQLDKALACFKKMVEMKGGENVGPTFDVLIHELCKKKSVEDALKVLKEMVTKRNVQPWQCTYKFVIEKVLSKGNVKESSTLLDLMKRNGFPPFIDPFIAYVSKSGTAEDAMLFLKAMTNEEFPSTSVFLRVFEALLVEGRHQVAHDLLSLSPGRVRNHADVLDLFNSMKPDEAATAAAL